jgi:phosphoribosylanthranilate isomerase
MTKIKICGITRLQDALEASRAGADALGFNFSSISPRMIDPEAANEIIRKLPPFIESAGIFVDQTPAEINAICRFCNLDIAQLHDEHYSAKDAQSITNAKVIKVYRPLDDFAVGEVLDFAKESGINTFLFDAYQAGVPGGTGQSIRAGLAARIFNELESSCFAILAGGLNELNVSDAIISTHPYAVDTASGVESSPGLKDPNKIRAFIRAIRQCRD